LEHLLAAVEPHDLSPVQMSEQLPFISRDQVDQFVVKRFLIGKRLALENRLFSQCGISSAFGYDRTQGRGCVVLQLLADDGFHLRDDEGMGRAGVCSRRHRCHIATFQHDESG